MNEFDQWMQHELKVKNYARYTDDFVIISNSRAYLEGLLPSIEHFLRSRLKLELHPEKVFIQPCGRGLDFLGYILFPHHRLVRTRTRRRMLHRLRQKLQARDNGLLSEAAFRQSLSSYLGVLSHANTYDLSNDVKNSTLAGHSSIF
jgi:hypothetical protein